MRGGQRFYFDFKGEQGWLPPTEGAHVVKVLRKRVGERITVIDGKGKEFLAEILRILRERGEYRVQIKLLDLVRSEELPEVSLTALIPVLKGDKTEFLIEKGTELGISKFIVYQSKHTLPQITKIKMERLREKALNALKQSGRLIFPQIDFAPSLTELLLSLRETSTFKILAHPTGKTALGSILEELKQKPKEIYLLSGPEGDLSAEELELASKSGFLSLNLSPFILRAETASISLMSLFSFLTRFPT